MSRPLFSKSWMESPLSRKGYVVYIGAALIIAAACLIYVPQIISVFKGQAPTLTVEVVDTFDARALGLSGRTELPDNYGMLFVFDTAERQGFWMKDMQVPIDIFWLKDNGTILDVKENVSPDTYPDVFYPSAPVRYVLETRAGFASNHALTKGDSIPGLKISDYVSK